MAEIVTRTRTYVTEVREEMRKVTWPDWEQLKSSTWAILLFVLVVAIIIGLMDFTVRSVIKVILGLFA